MNSKHIFSRIFSFALLFVSLSSASIAQGQGSEQANSTAVSAESSADVTPVAQATKRFALALRYTRLGRKNDAIANAMEAYKLNPSWDKPALLIALNFMDLGKWDDAARFCQASIRLNRNSEDAHAALTAIYFRAFKPFEAISTGESYLKMFPRGHYRDQVQDQIAEADRNKKYFLSKQPKWDVGSNYLDQTSDKGKIRWQASSMPLRVYIAASNDERQAALDDRLRQAFMQWQQSSHGYVSFAFVNDEKTADINCNWQDRTNAVAERTVERPVNSIVLDSSTKSKTHAGEVSLTLGQSCIAHASVQLMTPAQNLPVGTALDQLQVSALHQIGHCLGLVGHSNNKADLMHEVHNLEKKNSEREAQLNDRDVNTILALYKQAPQDYIADTGYSVELSSNEKRSLSKSYNETSNQVSQISTSVSR